jgi:hypothetical protein
MFRCGLCNAVSKPHDSPVKLVTKTREKEYTYTDRYGNILPVKPSYKKRKTGEIARGTEIVEEKIVCRECANKTI